MSNNNLKPKFVNLNIIQATAGIIFFICIGLFVLKPFVAQTVMELGLQDQYSSQNLKRINLTLSPRDSIEAVLIGKAEIKKLDFIYSLDKALSFQKLTFDHDQSKLLSTPWQINLNDYILILQNPTFDRYLEISYSSEPQIPETRWLVPELRKRGNTFFVQLNYTKPAWGEEPAMSYVFGLSILNAAISLVVAVTSYSWLVLILRLTILRRWRSSQSYGHSINEHRLKSLGYNSQNIIVFRSIAGDIVLYDYDPSIPSIFSYCPRPFRKKDKYDKSIEAQKRMIERMEQVTDKQKQLINLQSTEEEKRKILKNLENEYKDILKEE